MLNVGVMRATRLLALLLVALAATAFGAEQPLKVDRARSFIEVDVKSTTDSFTARLEKYQPTLGVDAGSRIKTAKLEFRFADLKTGKAERDEKMLEWLGGAEASGRFELGVLALAPNGEGQTTGRLTFHGVTQRIEFPVHVARAGLTYTIKGEVTLDTRNWNLKVIRMMGLLKVDPEVKVRFQLIGDLPPPPEE